MNWQVHASSCEFMRVHASSANASEAYGSIVIKDDLYCDRWMIILLPNLDVFQLPSIDHHGPF